MTSGCIKIRAAHRRRQEVRKGAASTGYDIQLMYDSETRGGDTQALS